MVLNRLYGQFIKPEQTRLNHSSRQGAAFDFKFPFLMTVKKHNDFSTQWASSNELCQQTDENSQEVSLIFSLAESAKKRSYSANSNLHYLQTISTVIIGTDRPRQTV